MAIVRDPIKCEACGLVREFVRPDFSVGELHVLQAFKGVTWRGEMVPLTKQEFDLLELIARRSQTGQGAYKELVYEALFAEREVDPKIIDVLVCKIRRKFKRIDPAFDYIETMWGRGYRLVLPPSRPQIDPVMAIRYAVDELGASECQEFLQDSLEHDMVSIASDDGAGWAEFPAWVADNK